jgi:hypothetical protein
VQGGSVLGRDIASHRLENALDKLSNSHYVATIMGVNYEHGFTSDGGVFFGSVNPEASAYYNLNGQFTTLTGSYGPRDNTRSGVNATLTIYGDGNRLGSFNVAHNDPIQQFTVNVAGVSQLRFSYSFDRAGRSELRFAVVDAVVR